MENIDSLEISRFEQLASQWWDLEGDFKPLHEINPLRLNYLDQRFSLNGRRILDVGCGGGILSEGMFDRGATVIGIDAGSAPIAVAKLHAKETSRNIQYQQGTTDDFGDEHHASFDAITCMEVLEHVPHPDQTLATCAKLVRPGGSIFCSTINRNPKSWVYAILGAEYIFRMLPRGTHRYDRLIRPSELHQWGRQSGLQLLDLTGLHYNPFSKVYSIGPGVDVNYIMHFVRD
ncbi:MAG: bifunctional 3-demethylubiquinol 3-O-methyltransferase/2-polyprenyl-6-hydroxyphenol methylase [Acidiferrobacteraceae bacterium]|nr:bifunctional 3-demethylubiquinol 3-O-methyltransferase/2-polyprenyl-6-hydroxyphenol methylase [Acidiferrobacteraceae bacterium]|tara:strand:+ start:204 stop:899 length:696 start_codon:yes stop_codon:yes gene_type:complete